MTHLEYFKYFLKVMLEEKKKFNLYEPDLVTRISKLNFFDGPFISPYERCAYIYKFATSHFVFMKNCFGSFFNNFPKIKELLLKWRIKKNKNFCSMSPGPALDYLAFIIALTENVEVGLQISFDDPIRIISKSTEWRNTYNCMIEAIQMGNENFPVSMICENIKMIQNNKQKFNEKQRQALQNADILCMVKTLCFFSNDISPEIKQYLKEIIYAMKADGLLLCIDTKFSVLALLEILFEIPGEYIFQPVYKRTKLLQKIPDDYKEKYGVTPSVSASGWFFVWKKFPSRSPYIKIFPSLLIEKTSSHTEIKTPDSSTGVIDELSLNSLKDKESNISARCTSKIESGQKSIFLCESATKHSKPNVANSDLVFHDQIKSPQAINDCSSFEESSDICSETSRDTFAVLNQENSFLSPIEKSFNESMIASEQQDSMSAKIPLFSGLNSDTKCLTLNESDSRNYSNQTENLNNSETILNQSPSQNLDNLSSSTSYSSNTSISDISDDNILHSSFTYDKVNKNKSTCFIEKTSNDGKKIEGVSSNQLDISKKKVKNKQTANHLLPPKKKFVQDGSDLELENEENYSIQDLKNRVKKLVSSFERNKQCKVAEENTRCFKYQSCCKSSLSCSSISTCHKTNSICSINTSVSSSDCTELLSSQRSNTSHSDEANVHALNKNTHNCHCTREHVSCKCRLQNCSSGMVEKSLSCMTHSCNHDTLPFNRCCGHGSLSGLNLTGPNIIIPLQNISEDTLAQLLTVLKTASSSKH